jgi:putative hydrolase of HD superfamily
MSEITPSEQQPLSPQEKSFSRLADFIFEAGMLRFTPRTGYQFLGSGQENVAEHSFRAAIIGYVLAQKTGADAPRTALLCLFHDFAEARASDHNYVNKRYATRDERRALEDAVSGMDSAEDILALQKEFLLSQSLEAQLAHDADQLDLIFNLRREQDLGNPYAAKWLDSVKKRLLTAQAKELAKAADRTDHTNWWLPDVEADSNSK